MALKAPSFLIQGSLWQGDDCKSIVSPVASCVAQVRDPAADVFKHGPRAIRVPRAAPRSSISAQLATMAGPLVSSRP